MGNMTDKTKSPKLLTEMERKIPYSTKLPGWLLKKMRQHHLPMSIMVEEALIEKYGWRKDEDLSS